MLTLSERAYYPIGVPYAPQCAVWSNNTRERLLMNVSQSWWLKYGKRPFDMVSSAALLIILSPLLFLVACSIRLAEGSPVLFSQTRIGHWEREIKVYKFRTMSNACDPTGELLPSNDRITPLGQFLRRTSLDELPQLLSVFRGDLSLVGPRPLLVEYLPLYSDVHRQRHAVRPGITGLAQVSGRNSLAWAEKFDLDVEYVRSATLRRDFAILLRTVTEALHGSNIYNSEGRTSERFTGYVNE